MTELGVTPWKRFGHDRLYVTAADGTQIGYWDNLTSTAHAEYPEQARLIVEAVAAWSERPTAEETATAGGEAAPESDHLVLPDQEVEPPTWVDLAANKPGAEARAQATALKEAAPFRTFLARAFNVKTDERAWRIGADGEKEVARQLRKLGPQWRVIHAIPVGNRGSDIDHLVIGPTGVFTINTKTHPDARIWVHGDTIKVNGHNQPYVRNARHEAERAGRLLTRETGISTTVRGIVVFYGVRGGFTIKSQPEDVHVTTRREVAAWIRNRQRWLTDERIDTLYEAARRSTTWT